MPQSEYTCSCNVVHPDAVEAARRAMLPEETADTLSGFFRVLGDGTRVRILWALCGRELCVCDLCAVLGMTKSAVSHQLSLLRLSRLVKCRRDGKTVYYSLDDEHVRRLMEAGLEHVNE